MTFRSFPVEILFLALFVAALILHCRAAILSSKSGNKLALRQSLVWVAGLGLLLLGSVVLPVILAQSNILPNGLYNVCYFLQMFGIALIIIAGLISTKPAQQSA